MFAIVDCNNFYASCERVFAPKLRGKPIVVLSNNDGCVIARSNEAKALGYGMGDPYFKIRDKLQADGVVVVSSNYALYGDMSARVMQVLQEFSGEMEIYSIDEAFLDVSGFKDLGAHARNLRETVVQYTGIPVGVGVAPTKTLAKIANRVAKKWTGFNGLCVLDRPELWKPVLEKIEVGDVWGIGRQYAEKLKALRIVTAAQFAALDDAWLRREMTVAGLRTAQELRGISCIALEVEPEPKKGITVSRSFGHRITDLKQLEQALSHYVERAGEKLRREKLLAKHLQVFVYTNPHATDFKKDPRHAPSVSFKLPFHTSDTAEISHYTLHALRRMYKPGYRYMKGGVILTDIVAAGSQNADLFDGRDTAKSAALMAALDKINRDMGRGTLHYAASGIERSWKMNQNLVSPNYTTSWSELVCVR